MPARGKTGKTQEEPQPTFEESLAELESIVESMESEQLPLEDLVSRYEAGTVLLKHCDSILSSAQKRIELITLSNNAGKTDQSPSSPIASDEKSEDPDADANDISLF